ncbi:unnamed protein product [Coffea canephora]|uniref:Uncharacterized protein n=1 Tax=Coffea canephora TaxID=49390 RepID=A0A068UH67_COFCA|nr:unnamed protein product [Coffea canephora]
MVSRGKASLLSENYSCWLLEWMVVLHLWTTGQETCDPAPRKVIGKMRRTKLHL